MKDEAVRRVRRGIPSEDAILFYNNMHNLYGFEDKEKLRRLKKPG